MNHQPANGTEAAVIDIPPEALAIRPIEAETLSVIREPEIVLAEATRAATALKTVIDAKAKKVKFNGEVYLEFEDWQTMGRFYGVSPRVTSTRYVEFGESRGFEATADAIISKTGQVVSSAEAMCLTDEAHWNMRAEYEWKDNKRTKTGERPVPLFQLRSMAQTRACAKALRNVLAWVVVLAGYKPTPAEEMGEVIQQKMATALCSECGDDVFEDHLYVKNSKLLFGKTLCKICQRHATPKEQRPAPPTLMQALKGSIKQANAKKAAEPEKVREIS